METTMVQQVCSEVDPVQGLMKPYKEILTAEQIENLKKTLLDNCNVFAAV